MNKRLTLRTWLIPIGVCSVGALAVLGLKIGPPWPSETETAEYTVLLVAAAFLFMALYPNRHVSQAGVLRWDNAVLLAFVLCVCGYLLLKLLFCYNAADWQHQVAGGFVLRPEIAELLAADPALTVEKLLDEAKNESSSIWEPWSVGVVRALLLGSWLLSFLCIAVVIGRIARQSPVWSLDDRIRNLVPAVEPTIRRDLESILSTLRQANFPPATIVLMSSLALRLFRLIYEAAGKPWPSDNLFSVIVHAGKGDAMQKIKGYQILPETLDYPLHALRVFSNKVDHGIESIAMGVEEAELVLNAFLALVRWFYCESGLVPKVPSIYRFDAVNLGGAVHPIYSQSGLAKRSKYK